MKRLILCGAAAFVLALSAGTGIRVLLAPPAASSTEQSALEGVAAQKGEKPADDRTGGPADSTAATRDSAAVTAGVSPAGGTATDETSKPDLPAAPDGGAGARVAAGADSAPSGVAPASPIMEPPGSTAQPIPPRDGYRQLAKILVNMKAVEAAKILEQLDDDQAVGLLRGMGARQAAAVLAKLPIDRAALLSKQLVDSSSEVSK